EEVDVAVGPSIVPSDRSEQRQPGDAKATKILRMRFQSRDDIVLSRPFLAGGSGLLVRVADRASEHVVGLDERFPERCRALVRAARREPEPCSVSTPSHDERSEARGLELAEQIDAGESGLLLVERADGVTDRRACRSCPDQPIDLNLIAGVLTAQRLAEVSQRLEHEPPRCPAPRDELPDDARKYVLMCAHLDILRRYLLKTRTEES